MSFEAIHRYAKPGMGSVNTYWIETTKSLIVVDGQRELSSAREARKQMDGLGKPVAAVFLTHPHPDHFGGLEVFAPADSNVPIYGSSQTRESMRVDRWHLIKASQKLLGEDFPSNVRLPTQILSDNQPVEIDGVRLVPGELGEGEAECMTALWLPDQRALFSGDLVQHRMTAFLLEGRSGSWLRQLHGLFGRYPDAETIYPGHGEPGPATRLVTDQREYLETFRALVRDEPNVEAAVKKMEQQFAGYAPVAAIEDLLMQDAKALARE